MLEQKYVEPQTKTEKIIAQLWAEILEQPQISMTDNFFDLGGNSLKVAELSVKLLQQFSLSIPAKILIDLPFVPVMAEYIDSNGTQFTDTSPYRKISSEIPFWMKTLFLTKISVTLRPVGFC